MADIVPVTPSASYTVWAEDFASSGVMQRVKVVIGAVDVDGGDVAATNPMPVSGAVSVSAMPAVSISVSAVLGTVVTVLGTQVVSVVPGVSVNALVTGPVSISAMPAVSISVSAVLGTVVTLLGTVAVNIVAGGAAPGTTAATQSAISAQVIWLAPTQTISATVNTIAAGFSVNALVTGPVSISAMPAISISVSAALGTVITILGTQIVSVVPGVSVNALVTGPVSISAMPAISISVSAALGTVITILGTQVVSVVPGLSVSAAVAVVSTVVTILGTQVVTVALLNFTTATPTVTATGPIVWLANTVTVTVTATVTGSLIISGIAVVTTAASVSVSGLPVWLNPTQQVVVSGFAGQSVSAMVSVSALAASLVMGTIIAVSGVTAVSNVSTVVTVLGTVSVREIGAQAVMIVVTSTAGVISATVYNFTIWTGAIGAPAAAGTTSWAVPNGKTIRFQNIQAVVNSSAVTGGTVTLFLCAAGATGSHISASVSTQMQVLKLQVLVSAGPVAASLLGNNQDVGAGTSIAFFGVGSTAYNIQQVAILGYLF